MQHFIKGNLKFGSNKRGYFSKIISYRHIELSTILHFDLDYFIRGYSMFDTCTPSWIWPSAGSTDEEFRIVVLEQELQDKVRLLVNAQHAVAGAGEVQS